jgi:hypothetical protein
VEIFPAFFRVEVNTQSNLGIDLVEVRYFDNLPEAKTTARNILLQRIREDLAWEHDVVEVTDQVGKSHLVLMVVGNKETGELEIEEDP